MSMLYRSFLGVLLTIARLQAVEMSINDKFVNCSISPKSTRGSGELRCHTSPEVRETTYMYVRRKKRPDFDILRCSRWDSHSPMQCDANDERFQNPDISGEYMKVPVSDITPDLQDQYRLTRDFENRSSSYTCCDLAINDNEDSNNEDWKLKVIIGFVLFGIILILPIVWVVHRRCRKTRTPSDVDLQVEIPSDHRTPTKECSPGNNIVVNVIIRLCRCKDEDVGIVQEGIPMNPPEEEQHDTDTDSNFDVSPDIGAEGRSSTCISGRNQPQLTIEVAMKTEIPPGAKSPVCPSSPVVPTNVEVRWARQTLHRVSGRALQEETNRV